MRLPTHQLHKASGRGRVHLSGRDIYTGRWGSPEAQREYDRVVAEWLANCRSLPATKTPALLTTADVARVFMDHARAYYPKTQCRTSEVRNFEHALRPLLLLYGATPANSLSPLALKTVQSAMVQGGLSRPTVNARVKKIRHFIRWAVSEGLVDGSVLHALASVMPLRRGRTLAPEPEPVVPVPQAHIDAIESHVRPVIWAMVQVQRLTGMRPGELVIMSARSIDVTGDAWLYRPAHHKTQHHGLTRVIWIGPKAQAFIRPFLSRSLDAALFTTRTSRPYTVGEYGLAVSRGAKRAGVPVWWPNRLRHTYGTEIRRELGLDAAQAGLGHARLEATQVYAERQAALARQAALRFG